MTILLHSNRTAGEIGEEFNNFFPYLKIVFVARKPVSDGPVVVEAFDPSTRLIEINGMLKEPDININSTDTVKEVEEKFERQCGLPVQIFRIQKGIWMDTGVTDDLTLHEQNTWGREASKPLKIKLNDHFSRNNISLGK